MMRLPCRMPVQTDARQPGDTAHGGSAYAALAALLVASLVMQTACGGGQAETRLAPRPGIEVDMSAPEKYAMALRMAALARVETRSGQDELAAEHFRAAYKLHETTQFLFAFGQAAERAGLHAEAHEAARRALTHDLSDEQRKSIEDNVKRLAALVPPGLQRVAILVKPQGARVELSREAVGHAAVERRGPERIVIGSGEVFLKPGTWHLETSAKGFSSELRTFEVGGAEGDVIAIQLHLEDQGPALVGTPNAKQPKVIEKRLLPDGQEKKVEVKPGPTVYVETHPAPPQQGFVSKYGPVGTTILGVLAVGAGGWFGYQTQVAGDNANAVLPGGADYNAKTYRQDNLDYLDQANQNALLAQGLFIGGGALIAVGTVWWMLSPSAATAPAPELSAAPEPSFTLSGVALNWRF